MILVLGKMPQAFICEGVAHKHSVERPYRCLGVGIQRTRARSR
jgi:hypothetical protein